MRPLTDHQRALAEFHAGLIDQGVRRFIRAHGSTTLDESELWSGGALGLMQGVAGFDPARGIPFVVHLRQCIRWGILNVCRDSDHLTRPQRSAVRVLRRAESSGPDEPVDADALTPGMLEFARLHGSARHDGLEALPDWTEIVVAADRDPAERAQDGDLAAWLLASVSADERRFLVWTFWDALDADTIGERLGVSRQRVYQIRSELLARLRRIASTGNRRHRHAPTQIGARGGRRGRAG